MSEVQNTEEQPTKSKSGSLTLFIILFIMSLGLSTFLFLKYVKNAAKIEKQNEELSLAYEALNLHADSLQRELDMVMIKFENEINKNLAQEDLKQELRNELMAQKQELTSAYDRIQSLINESRTNTNSSIAKDDNSSSGKTPKSLVAAKAQINQLVKINYEYIDKIEKLQNEYIQEKAKSDSVQYVAQSLQFSNDSLLISNIQLQEDLSNSNPLLISKLNITPIREKNGVQEIVDKSKKVQRLKIKFIIPEGKPTEEVEKEVTIRIIAPNGSVLTQYNDELSNIDDLYTLNETVTYDGSEKSFIYYYDQKANYKPGVYQVEILHENRVLNQNEFYLY